MRDCVDVYLTSISILTAVSAVLLLQQAAVSLTLVWLPLPFVWERRLCVWIYQGIWPAC